MKWSANKQTLKMGIRSKKGKKLHGWQQSSIRMQAKPQLWPQPSSNRTSAASLLCLRSATRWQHRVPRAEKCGQETCQCFLSIFPRLVWREIVSHWFGLGGARRLEKTANRHCENFLFAFLNEKKKVFEMLFFFISSQCLEDFFSKILPVPILLWTMGSPYLTFHLYLKIIMK